MVSRHIDSGEIPAIKCNHHPSKVLARILSQRYHQYGNGPCQARDVMQRVANVLNVVTNISDVDLRMYSSHLTRQFGNLVSPQSPDGQGGLFQARKVTIVCLRFGYRPHLVRYHLYSFNDREVEVPRDSRLVLIRNEKLMTGNSAQYLLLSYFLNLDRRVTSFKRDSSFSRSILVLLSNAERSLCKRRNVSLTLASRSFVSLSRSNSVACG